MNQYWYRRCCSLLVFAFFLCTTSAATISRADSITYSVFNGNACSSLPLGQFFFVSATLNLSAPAKYVRMSGPSVCGLPVTWNYPVSGPNNDLTVDLGGCISGSVVLYSAAGVYGGPTCCPSYFHGPHPGGVSEESPPMLIGCDDQPRYLIPPCSTGAPGLVAPADGAAASQTPTLSWSHAIGSYCEGGLGVPTFELYYGTSATNLNHKLSLGEQYSTTLPLLSPGTQYYWRVMVSDGVVYYTGSQANVSEIRSFTTSGPVATQPATWGMIKSMYRD